MSKAYRPARKKSAKTSHAKSQRAVALKIAEPRRAKSAPVKAARRRIPIEGSEPTPTPNVSSQMIDLMFAFSPLNIILRHHTVFASMFLVSPAETTKRHEAPVRQAKRNRS